MRKRERGSFHTSGPPRLIRYLYVHVKDAVPNEKYSIVTKLYTFVRVYFPPLVPPKAKKK